MSETQLQYIKNYIADNPSEVSKPKTISRDDINREFSAFHRIQYYIQNLEFDLATVELQYLQQSLREQMTMTIKQAQEFYEKYNIHYNTVNYKLVIKQQETYINQIRLWNCKCKYWNFWC